MLLNGCQFPDPDFTVLMGGEDFTVDKSHRFCRTRRWVLVIESVDKGEICEFKDVDFIGGSSIEEFVVHGKESDVGISGIKRIQASGGDCEV